MTTNTVSNFQGSLELGPLGICHVHAQKRWAVKRDLMSLVYSFLLFRHEMYLKPKSNGIDTNTHFQLGVITPAAVWKNTGSPEECLGSERPGFRNVKAQWTQEGTFFLTPFFHCFPLYVAFELICGLTHRIRSWPWTSLLLVSIQVSNRDH